MSFIRIKKKFSAPSTNRRSSGTCVSREEVLGREREREGFFRSFSPYNVLEHSKSEFEEVRFSLTEISRRIADQSSKIRISYFNFDLVQVSEESEVLGVQKSGVNQCVEMTEIQLKISRKKMSEVRSMHVVVFAFLLHQN